MAQVQIQILLIRIKHYIMLITIAYTLNYDCFLSMVALKLEILNSVIILRK